MPEFINATVVQHTNPASTFHVIKLKTEMPEFDFEPGQYICVKVKENKINKYSIASMPGGNELVLIVDVKPEGDGSKFFKNLQIDQSVPILGPMGVFKMHLDDPVEEVVFMATGSGVSPLKSMIDYLLLKTGEHSKRISLYFGLRNCDDIFLHEYFGDLTDTFKNFKFVPCLSQPDVNWEGKCGHITELIKQDYKTGNGLAIYLCGNEKMIVEGSDYFKSIGVPEGRIYYEKFSLNHTKIEVK